MKKNITITGTEKNLNTAIAILTAMGIEVVTEDAKAETTVTKPAKATKNTKESKSEDTFPRTEYIAMAKAIGCLSKKGTVWNSCRSIVYDAIGWDSEAKTVGKPKLTKAEAKKAVDKVKKENGWK